MAKNNVRMPQSTAGVTSFSDASISRFHLTPIQVVGFIIAVLILIILLNLFGRGL